MLPGDVVLVLGTFDDGVVDDADADAATGVCTGDVPWDVDAIRGVLVVLPNANELGVQLR